MAGFGGKCGFHFEAHIAALAKAARRPVKLVFSRYEEFVAPDRRREGMIVDITTGVSANGTIVARTAWIAIDNGAYVADAAFFPQLAAMHVAGPYKIPALKIDSRLVYTNHQPSGSVRAPTAPQGCLGCRVPHRRGRQGRRHDPSSVPAAQHCPHRRRGPRLGRPTTRSASISASTLPLLRLLATN